MTALRRLALFVALTGALAACDVPGGDGAASDADPASDTTPDGAQTAAPARGFLAGLFQPMARPGPAPLRRVSVAGGDVVVSATDGYCVDPETLVARGGGGFVMLASCHILSGGTEGPNVPPVLVTVTVGPEGSGAVPPDAQTLAAISAAPLLSASQRGGLVLARLGQGGEEILEGGDPRYWRGAFVQGTRLVIMALYAPTGSALAGGAGGRLVSEVHARIRADSPGSGA